MSDNVIVALITAIGFCVTGILQVFILLLQRRTHNTFNSKMDLALQAQRALGAAEGRLEEQVAERIRRGEGALTKAQVDETVIK